MADHNGSGAGPRSPFPPQMNIRLLETDDNGSTSTAPPSEPMEPTGLLRTVGDLPMEDELALLEAERTNLLARISAKVNSGAPNQFMNQATASPAASGTSNNQPSMIPRRNILSARGRSPMTPEGSSVASSMHLDGYLAATTGSDQPFELHSFSAPQDVPASPTGGPPPPAHPDSPELLESSIQSAGSPPGTPTRGPRGPDGADLASSTLSSNSPAPELANALADMKRKYRELAVRFKAAQDRAKTAACANTASTRKWTSALAEHRAEVDSAQARVDALLDENAALKAQLRSAQDAAAAAEATREEELNSSTELRSMLLESVKLPSLASVEGRSKAAEESFWRELATPEVLAMSQPPPDFPIPEPGTAMTPGDPAALLASPTHTFSGRSKRAADATIAAAKAQALARKAAADLKAASTRVSKVEAALTRRVAAHAADKKALMTEIRKQQSHLKGAVRRIQYLVSKQQALQAEVKGKTEYIVVLEKKLIELAKYQSRVESSRLEASRNATLSRSMVSSSTGNRSKLGNKSKSSVTSGLRRGKAAVLSSSMVLANRSTRPDPANMSGISNPPENDSLVEGAAGVPADPALEAATASIGPDEAVDGGDEDPIHPPGYMKKAPAPIQTQPPVGAPPSAAALAASARARIASASATPSSTPGRPPAHPTLLTPLPGTVAAARAGGPTSMLSTQATAGRGSDSAGARSTISQSPLVTPSFFTSGASPLHSDSSTPASQPQPDNASASMSTRHHRDRRQVAIASTEEIFDALVAGSSSEASIGTASHMKSQSSTDMEGIVSPPTQAPYNRNNDDVAHDPHSLVSDHDTSSEASSEEPPVDEARLSKLREGVEALSSQETALDEFSVEEIEAYANQLEQLADDLARMEGLDTGGGSGWGADDDDRSSNATSASGTDHSSSAAPPSSGPSDVEPL